MACMNNAREKKKTGLCFCGASEQTTLKARFCCCFYICDGRTPPNKIRRTSFPHSILAREQNEAALFFFFCTLAKRHLLLFFFRRVLGTVNTLTLSAPPLLFSNFLFSPQIDFFFEALWRQLEPFYQVTVFYHRAKPTATCPYPPNQLRNTPTLIR